MASAMRAMADGGTGTQGIERTVDEWRAEAEALEAADRLDEAEAILAQIIEAKPYYPPALIQAAILAYKRKQTALATERLERVVGLVPDDATYRRNLCEIYRTASRLDDALAQALHALDLEPANAASFYNLAVLHYDRLETDQAIAYARRTLELEPDMAGAHFELAENLLLTGRFAEGWEEYEWRFRLAEAPPLLPPHDRPQWDGKPMPDGVLMLIGDQGFGDTIQFCRYIPEVAKLCPNILVACSPEMEPIIMQQPGVARYFSRWEEMPAFDAFCPLSGLPRLFGANLDNIHAPVPYLRADPTRSERWRRRLEALTPKGYRRVGLVWAGRPTHGNDFNRSTSLHNLAPLGQLERVALISLQMGDGKSQIGGYYGAAPLINLGPEIEDYDDTMAVLDNLDHLVTVDTSVAHLAGAMGRPVSILLPFAPDWRWLLERRDTPWYPSIELFRQPRPGSWAEPIQAVAERLKAKPGRK